MTGTLVIVRHGESTWNQQNLFTGWHDVELSEKGVAEASARTEQAESLLDRQIRAAIEDDAAAVVVLGSGAYAGRAGDFGAKYGVRFVEGLTAALGRLAGADRVA